ncbi:bifunctional 2-polyprenyl-6-hydroxyphenol methylase/3-demethylubiquinol 3-O-methyltransferase UbiG [Nesterenkonia sp. F]|uniref:class I SAM-dependent methyltransferase n=1 Tax=Nesterenkonia sp. F TaxID=795955 RepID=UPI0002F8796F|nr:methyltransferase domain-containing protein [Nesterenkonia sp. F]
MHQHHPRPHVHDDSVESVGKNPHSHSSHGVIPASAETWDAMYSGREQYFSGGANDALIAEAAGLPTGRALDVGCGEGGDALWLAARGWQVTGVDVSSVALARAAEAAEAVGLAEQVAFEQLDLTTAPPPQKSFDLVSVHYVPLPIGDAEGIRGLAQAVTVGGTLLFVTHDPEAVARRIRAEGHTHAPDPRDFHGTDSVAALLGAAWEIEAHDSRPRSRPEHAERDHPDDVVLRARRLR